jgi:hypothetical protein
LDDSHKNSAAGLDIHVKSGPALLLQFVVSLMAVDLEQWYQHLRVAGSSVEMTGTAQPLLARVLFSGSGVRWSRRCEMLCSKYTDALQQPPSASSSVYVSSLRSGLH